MACEAASPQVTAPPPLPRALSFVYDQVLPLTVVFPHIQTAIAARPSVALRPNNAAAPMKAATTTTPISTNTVSVTFLDSLVLARRRLRATITSHVTSATTDVLLPTKPNLTQRKGVDLQITLLNKAIYRSLSTGTLCALSRGHVIAADGQRAAADADSHVLSVPGASTHRDQFLSRDWIALLEAIGPLAMLQLLSGGNGTTSGGPEIGSYALFRCLPNNCFQQLTGVLMNEDVRELQLMEARSRSHQLKTTSLPPSLRTLGKEELKSTVTASPASVESTNARTANVPNARTDTMPHLRGRWVVPRTDTRPGAIVGGILQKRGAMRASVTTTLQVIRPLLGNSPSALRPGLPPAHAFALAAVGSVRTTLASANAARRLIHTIFVQRPHVRDVERHNTSHGVAAASQEEKRMQARTLPTAVASFRELLQHHMDLNYGEVLNRHCPCPDMRASGRQAARNQTVLSGQKRLRDGTSTASASSSTSTALSFPTPTAIEPAALVTPLQNVMAFIRAVLLRVVPPALFGNAAARRAILRVVWLWISSGSQDRLTLETILNGVPTSPFTVFSMRLVDKRPSKSTPMNAANAASTSLSSSSPTPHTSPREFSLPAHTSARQKELVQCWVLWLLVQFVHPLLFHNFYVTESETEHHRPLYFRKPVWARLSDAALVRLRASLQLRDCVLNTSSVMPSVTPLGVARLRLLPKATALRPIMNVSVDPAVVKQYALHCRDVRYARKSAIATTPSVPSDAVFQLLSNSRVSINKLLEPVHLLLRCARNLKPSIVGAAVFGMDGVYKSLRRFAMLRRRNLIASAPSNESVFHSMEPLHIVTCDVKSAYDTLLQPLTLQCATQALPVGDFEIRQYVVVRAGELCTLNTNATVGSLSSTESPAVSAAMRAVSTSATRALQFEKVALPVARRQPFHAQVFELSQRTRDAVFVDLGKAERFSRASIITLLQRHVSSHAVMLPSGEILSQGCGVPQGSVLSSMLCNLYLAKLEQEALLPRLLKTLHVQEDTSTTVPREDTVDTNHTKDNTAASERVRDTNSETSKSSARMMTSLLMRHTDDFVLLTPSLPLAKAFAVAMHANFPIFNVTIATQKSRSSVDISLHGTAGSRNPMETLRATGSGPSIPAVVPWCGLLFDARNGNVTSDYSRYCGPNKVRASLSVSLLPTPIAGTTRLLLSFIRPKCHPLLLDGIVNDLPTAALNAYQLCLVAAAKFACLLRILRREHGIKFDDDAVCTIIEQGCVYFINLVRKLCPGQKPTAHTFANTASTLPQPVCNSNTEEGKASHTTHHKLLIGTSISTWLCQEVDGVSEDNSTNATAPTVLTDSCPLTPSRAFCAISNSELRWLYQTAFMRAFTRIQYVNVVTRLRTERETLEKVVRQAIPSPSSFTLITPLRRFVLRASAPNKSVFFEHMEL